MATKGGTTTDKTLRVVLLGKTGAGKSTLGNALTGLPPIIVKPGDERDKKPQMNTDPTKGFKVARGLMSCTRFCDWKTAERMGVVLEVTDTPGLCDTGVPEDEIYREVAKSVAVAEPGPHVILFVARCDRRFTKEEQCAYQKIKQLFSEEMNKHLILVFSGMDAFADDDDDEDHNEDGPDPIEAQREALAKQLKTCEPQLKEMLEEAGYRYFGMNGKTSKKEKDRQVRDLLDQMKILIKSNGQHAIYKTEMTEQIMKRLEVLIADEAYEKHVSKEEAMVNVKKDIVAGKIKPSVWESIVDVVVKAIGALVNAIKDACSLM